MTLDHSYSLTEAVNVDLREIMPINKLRWKTLPRCNHPQDKWCKPRKFTINLKLKCNQAYLKCISNLLRYQDVHFGQPNSALSRNCSPSKNPSTLIRSCNTLQHCVQWAAAKNGQFCPILATCFHLLFLVSSCDCPESQISIRKLITTWSGSGFSWTNKLIQINYIVTPWLDVMARSWWGHARESEEEDRAPLQWQLTDLIQCKKKPLHLKSPKECTGRYNKSSEYLVKNLKINKWILKSLGFTLFLSTSTCSENR